jgi:competence protein ComFC
LPLQGESTFCWLCWQTLTVPMNCCRGCGLPEAGPLCRECRSEPKPFALVKSCFLFSGQLARAIHRFKYRGDSFLCCLLGREMKGLARTSGQLTRIDLVIPVPLFPRRLRQRGFNQSALLAVELARGSGIMVHTSALAKRKDSSPQAELGLELRKKNVQDVFRADPRVLRGRRVLLVDDVMTTGSTVLACTKELLAAGAREVHVLTLARSMP